MNYSFHQMAIYSIYRVIRPSNNWGLVSRTPVLFSLFAARPVLTTFISQLKYNKVISLTSFLRLRNSASVKKNVYIFTMARCNQNWFLTEEPWSCKLHSLTVNI